MASAFSGFPTRYDMLFVEQMATYQYSGGLGGILAVCRALSPGKLIVVSGLISGTFALVVFKSDFGFEIASISGTASVGQLVAEMAGSYLIPYDSVPGQASTYSVFDLSVIVYAMIKICDADKPLVFMGHSLGGATAQLAASYMQQRTGQTIRGVYTIGSPKPGNADFAAGQSYPVFRLVNEGDIVPSIPAAVPGLGLITGYPSQPLDWPFYTQTGTAITQTAYGSWAIGEMPMDAAHIVAALASGGVSSHAVDSYLSGTRTGLPTKAKLQPFADGYEKPWNFFGMVQQPPKPGSKTGGGIATPASFTNRIEVYAADRVGNTSLLGTVADDPPHSWSPPLQPRQGAGGCCA